ncbi:MAG: UDP-N-acetylmuramoyl-L-alanyl-D-glutamate--2,6-diaminopimelate ligase [Pseudomonadota bacterium]
MSGAGVSVRRLPALLAGCAPAAVIPDCEVTALTEDSRQAGTGAVFFARKGVRVDGARFISDALEAGASAVVMTTGTKLSPSDDATRCVAVKDVSYCFGVASDRFFGSPSAACKVVGVTGTNGKTSIAYSAAQLLDDEDGTAACFVLGTLGAGRPGALTDGELTTPSAGSVHRQLRSFVDQGAAYTVMEVSSHALDQQRVAGVCFDVAVFSNLTRDHLDYHRTLEAYGEAKRKLFAMPGLRTAVVNIDDPFGREIVESLPNEMSVLTFGAAHSNSQFRHLHADDASFDATGLSMSIALSGDVLGRVDAPLLGAFNASNLLASVGVALALDVPFEAIQRRARRMVPAPGRMQRVSSGMGEEPAVVVDYAHTPDALSNALRSLRSVEPHRTLWCVFGCGGDRDQGKRFEMGQIAEQLADRVVVTSDNPRSESPRQIIDDILAGLRQHANVVIEEDRRLAIASTVRQAANDDIVLIAGKGHEQYQEVAGVRYPMVDQVIALGALQERHA